MVPGRALVAGSGQVVQVARPADGVAAAVRAHGGPPRRRRSARPCRSSPCPPRCASPTSGPRPTLGARPWRMPDRRSSEATRAAVGLVAYQGEHGSGHRSRPVGQEHDAADGGRRRAARATRATWWRWPVPGRRCGDARHRRPRWSPRARSASAWPPLADGAAGRVLVLVDDAEAIDDVGGVLDRLSTSDRPDLLFVAAGRNDGIRTGYSHWTRPLRRSKLGVLLRPDVDLDGDILGVTGPAAAAGGDGTRSRLRRGWPARPSSSRSRCPAESTPGGRCHPGADRR